MPHMIATNSTCCCQQCPCCGTQSFSSSTTQFLIALESPHVSRPASKQSVIVTESLPLQVSRPRRCSAPDAIINAGLVQRSYAFVPRVRYSTPLRRMSLPAPGAAYPLVRQMTGADSATSSWLGLAPSKLKAVKRHSQPHSHASSGSTRSSPHSSRRSGSGSSSDDSDSESEFSSVEEGEPAASTILSLRFSMCKPEDKCQDAELRAQARHEASRQSSKCDYKEEEHAHQAVIEEICLAIQEARNLELSQTNLPRLQAAKDRLVRSICVARNFAVAPMEVQEANVHRRRVHHAVQDIKGQVRVCCRVRNLNERERVQGDDDIVRIVDDMTLEIPNHGAFSFDSVFAPGTQAEVFEECRDMIQSAVDGRNVTIMTYGQTGAGKTYTMFGKPHAKDTEGIAARTIAELFAIIDGLSDSDVTVTASMVELYNNRLIDIFKIVGGACAGADASRRVSASQDGSWQLEGFDEVQVDDATALDALMQRGLAHRATAAHAMNVVSSRSHLIFTVKVSSVCRQTGHALAGKILLCDLGGAERIKKTGASGERQKEAIEMNKSLSALGNVVEAIAKGHKRVPYRDHKLTQIMQDSLGGTAKALMLVNCSPASSDLGQTMTALTYAARMKKIVNKARQAP